MKRFNFILVVLLSLAPAFAEKIKFSADSMSGQAGSSSTTTTMTGNASVATESIEIKADMLQLSGDDYKNISAQGSVSGKNLDTNMEFSCDSLSYDRVTKQILLKGNVKLIDVDNNVNCGAQIIEYDQDKDIAIMQIQISLTQKDNICSGSYAVYYKEQQLLEISGNAQVKQKKDTFRAQFITLDLDTQDITLGGNVKGTVTDSKENSEEENAAASTDGDESVADGEEASVQEGLEGDASAAADSADEKAEAAVEGAASEVEADAAAEESSSKKSKKTKVKKGKN